MEPIRPGDEERGEDESLLGHQGSQRAYGAEPTRQGTVLDDGQHDPDDTFALNEGDVSDPEDEDVKATVYNDERELALVAEEGQDASGSAKEYMKQAGLCASLIGISIYESVFKSRAVRTATFDFNSLLVMQAAVSIVIGVGLAVANGQTKELTDGFFVKLAKFSPVGIGFAAAAYIQLIALVYLSVDVFKVLEQSRLLVTAFFGWLLLKRKLSISSWVALVSVTLCCLTYGRVKTADKATKATEKAIRKAVVRTAEIQKKMTNAQIQMPRTCFVAADDECGEGRTDAPTDQCVKDVAAPDFTDAGDTVACKSLDAEATGESAAKVAEPAKKKCCFSSSRFWSATAQESATGAQLAAASVAPAVARTLLASSLSPGSLTMSMPQAHLAASMPVTNFNGIVTEAAAVSKLLENPLGMSQSKDVATGLAITAIFIMITASCGVYSELVLKKSHHTPFYVQKVFLELPGGVFSVLCTWLIRPILVSNGIGEDRLKTSFLETGLFMSWDSPLVLMTFALLLVKSWLSGIIVKQLSAVAKQVCSIISVAALYFVLLVHDCGNPKAFLEVCPSGLGNASFNIIVVDLAVFCTVVSYTTALRDKKRKKDFKAQIAAAEKKYLNTAVAQS